MSDSLQDHFLAVAHDEIARLPYELESDAVDKLNARIERGIATMREEDRTGDEDVALAEQHLRSVLEQAGSRAVLPAGGEPLVPADSVEWAFADSKWWPF